MTHIDTSPGTRKIAWTQDAHGQWSSGDLEVRPIASIYGLCWSVFLDGNCIGRSFGYSRLGVAKVAATMLKPVREVLQGRTADVAEDTKALAREVERLKPLAAELLDQYDRLKQMESEYPLGTYERRLADDLLDSVDQYKIAKGTP